MTGSDPLEIGQVGDLPGWDFEHRQIQRSQKIDAGQIESGREILNPDRVAVCLQLPVRIKSKVNPPHHLKLGLMIPGLHLLVIRLLANLLMTSSGTAVLILDDIRPRVLCDDRHLFCQREISVVVDSRLRNNQGFHPIRLLFSAK